jgi:hypothetical protein
MALVKQSGRKLLSFHMLDDEKRYPVPFTVVQDVNDIFAANPSYHVSFSEIPGGKFHDALPSALGKSQATVLVGLLVPRVPQRTDATPVNASFKRVPPGDNHSN